MYSVHWKVADIIEFNMKKLFYCVPVIILVASRNGLNIYILAHAHILCLNANYVRISFAAWEAKFFFPSLLLFTEFDRLISIFSGRHSILAFLSISGENGWWCRWHETLILHAIAHDFTSHLFAFKDKHVLNAIVDTVNIHADEYANRGDRRRRTITAKMTTKSFALHMTSIKSNIISYNIGGKIHFVLFTIFRMLVSAAN